MPSRVPSVTAPFAARPRALRPGGPGAGRAGLVREVGGRGQQPHRRPRRTRAGRPRAAPLARARRGSRRRPRRASSRTRRSPEGPAASATRARTSVRGAGGVQPPAVRRRCSRTRPRTLRSGRSWPASEPRRTSTSASGSISTPAASRRRRARRSRLARRTPRKAPRKAGSKASVSRRANAAGSLAQPSPSVRASSSARSGFPSASQRRAKTGVGRRAQRLAPEDGEVRERLRGRPFPGRRHVGVRGADDRERPRPEPARLALAEQRQPAAALAVAGPERLGLVEVPAVDLVEDLQEPRLLGLEERDEPEGAARLALGAAEAGDGGRARSGPRLVPAEPLLVEKHAASSRAPRARRARRPGGAPRRRPGRRAPPRRRGRSPAGAAPRPPRPRRPPSGRTWA